MEETTMNTGKKLFYSLVLAATAVFCVGATELSSAWAHCRDGWGSNGWSNGGGWGNGGYHRANYNNYNRGGGLFGGNWFGNGYRPGNRWGNAYRGYNGWRPGLAYGHYRHSPRYRRGYW